MELHPCSKKRFSMIASTDPLFIQWRRMALIIVAQES
jgi:hypothetical protein